MGTHPCSHGRKGQRTRDVPAMARGARDMSLLSWVEGTVHTKHVADGTYCGDMSLLP